MKKLLLILLIPNVLHAQTEKNIIKTNLSSWFVRNYNVMYERAIGKKTSLSLALRYMPKGAVPFKSSIKNMVNDPDFNIDDFEMGNTAVTLEFRWYLGKENFRGFYFAPYLRYLNYSASLAIQDPTLKEAAEEAAALGAPIAADTRLFFDGKINSFNAGLMIGSQFKLSKRIVLDWWIIGAHYGKFSGVLTAEIKGYEALPGTTEETKLNVKLDDLVSDTGPFKLTGKVTSPTSAEFASSGPWLGLRGLGICLGYKF